jgi:trigger factor
MKNTKEIKVKIEGKKWEDALEKAYKKASSNFQIDGFRKGKAPKSVFMKKYTQERLNFDAADICLNDAYDEMFSKAKDLEIVAQPEITLNDISMNGVEYLFTLTLKPEVKLGKYKGLGVKKDKVSVSKEEIEHEIEHLRSHYTENVVKENGAVASGDIAVIDFEGFKDGVAFPGGKGENYSLEIGSNTFIPGFEDQVIGMNVGETKDINVTFPEDYHAEDLKGAPVVFKVKVNEIKVKRVPELDADFFEDLGMEGIDSKESLEKQVKENIKVRKDSDAENKYVDELLEAAAKDVKVDIPDVMVDEELNRMVKQYEETLRMQGLSLEQFYQFTNSDESKLREQMKSEAIKRITFRLMLEEIAKAEKIEISEADAKKEVKDMASKYQMKEEEFLNAFGGIEMVKYDLKMRKSIEVLKGE